MTKKNIYYSMTLLFFVAKASLHGLEMSFLPITEPGIVGEPVFCQVELSNSDDLDYYVDNTPDYKVLSVKPLFANSNDSFTILTPRHFALGVYSPSAEELKKNGAVKMDCYLTDFMCFKAPGKYEVTIEVTLRSLILNRKMIQKVELLSYPATGVIEIIPYTKRDLFSRLDALLAQYQQGDFAQKEKCLEKIARFSNLDGLEKLKHFYRDSLFGSNKGYFVDNVGPRSQAGKALITESLLTEKNSDLKKSIQQKLEYLFSIDHDQ